MDDNDRLVAAEQRANFGGEIAQRVTVLGENNEFFAHAAALHLGLVLQKSRELVPFAVCAARAHGHGHTLEFVEGSNFGFELGYGGGSRSLVGYLFFGFFAFAGREVVVVIFVVGGQGVL
ncbi:MAG: hypothetical protein DDT37_01916 [Firmicutes bacterium]|nr:hypothetical protein [candidate division NPL-UPA2 bacterium]